MDSKQKKKQLQKIIFSKFFDKEGNIFESNYSVHLSEKSFRERMNEMNEQGFLNLCSALKEIFIGEIKKQS